MMLPLMPASIMCRATARSVSITPVRLIFSTRSQSAGRFVDEIARGRVFRTLSHSMPMLNARMQTKISVLACVPDVAKRLRRAALLAGVDSAVQRPLSLSFGVFVDPHMVRCLICHRHTRPAFPRDSPSLRCTSCVKAMAREL